MVVAFQDGHGRLYNPHRNYLMLPVAKLHIESKVVFLTNAKAVSYSESFLSFIKHYKLVTIVGEATAGANGNINHIALPSGMQVVFTGMRAFSVNLPQAFKIQSVTLETEICGLKD
jgi:C-terminal processing protease CtpA/Prc